MVTVYIQLNFATKFQEYKMPHVSNNVTVSFSTQYRGALEQVDDIYTGEDTDILLIISRIARRHI